MKARRTAPLATFGLAAVVLLAYGLESSAGVEAFCLAHGFDPEHPTLASALGSLFLHAGVVHLAGNVLALVVVGTVVEAVLGRRRLLALFVASGVGGAAMHWLVQPDADAALVGASGSIAGLMAVGAALRPRLMLGFVVSYIAMNVLALYITFPLVPAGTSVACHIGGFATGVAVVMIARACGAVEAWRLRVV